MIKVVINVKVVPKGIVERVWFNNNALKSMSLIEISATYEKTKLMTVDATPFGNLAYCDIEFPNRDGQFLVAASNDAVVDIQHFKVGSPAYEFIFSSSNMFENNLYIYSETGDFVNAVSGTNTGIPSERAMHYVFDLTAIPDGKYLLSLSSGNSRDDFKRYKKPATIDSMQVDVKSGKILLQPGFNMIAWQGNGYGSYADKSNASIVAKVAGCIAAQLNARYGLSSWRGCRTYDEKNGVFLDYINGVTPDDADGNFSLVISDNGNSEVKGIEFYSLSPTEMELEYF